ncbi:MAG TPA: rhomboid family intramembrane serine protease [Flavipsychrobacter sp.]|nr:rhomboid family intramembrane serine protease [Flavipsychrobacter sp.]
MAEFRQLGFQRLPPVVKNIIIINVIMVLIQFVLGRMGIDLAVYLGLHYWKSPSFHWWQLVTYIFMHGSYNDIGGTFTHIFFNMFALFFFGPPLENMWGPKRFFIFYMICGIGAALCQLTVLGIEFHSLENAVNAYAEHPTLSNLLSFAHKHGLDVTKDAIERWSSDPNCSDCINSSINNINDYYNEVVNSATVGASGAIMGVLFAFGYLFPNVLIYVWLLVPVKAKWAVAGFAVIELFAGVQNSAGDNVAHFAHLGGMLFAFILLRIWRIRVGNRYY